MKIRQRGFRIARVLYACIFVLYGLQVSAQRLIQEYTLTIREQKVHKAGTSVMAVQVNDSIPAPTLYFHEGDSAVIHIKNEMDEESSVHWHGILLPAIYDGVPYLTTPPIKPGGTYTVRFPIRQHGTYWYHSHSMMQEQRGLYGAIVIYPKQEPVSYDREIVLVLSDWTRENPHHIMTNLKRNTEWYAVKKGQALSLNRVVAHHGLAERIETAWQRMPPMDVSDVYYDAFLVNGEPTWKFPQLHPGERVRLRVVNGSSSTFFHLQFAGGKLEMIASDGQDIQPISVDRVLIGIAETYDFILTLPRQGAYEFRATAQDGTGHASVYLGNGPMHAAPDLPAPDLYHLGAIQMQGMEGMSMPGMHLSARTLARSRPYAEKAYLDREDLAIAGEGSMHGMDHGSAHMVPTEETHAGMSHGTHHHPAAGQMEESMPNASSGKTDKPAVHDMNHMDHSMGHMDHDMSHMPHMGHQGMADMEGSPGKSPTVAFNYDMLKARQPTAFDMKGHAFRRLTFTLTGSMWRYDWSINGKVLSEADSIQIRSGEILRITLVNETMMYHPMHLHGHFFRVLNKNGAYSPLKHTVIVPPMRTVTIEFLANEPGDWFFHCHVLYHMMAGMSRIFQYADYQRPESMRPFPLHMIYHEDQHWYRWGEITATSNRAEGYLSYSNRKNQVELKGEYGWQNSLNEAEASYAYFATRYLRPYVGVVTSNKDEYLKYYKSRDRHIPDQDIRAVAGVRYLLPFFLNADLRIDTRAHVRLGVDGETWLFPRVWLHYGANTDGEFRVGLEGMWSEHFSLTAGYHSDYKWGGGLTWRF
jgi:CopA family copper-resistance protein